MFNQPLDIAFDADDNFYVVQGHGGTSPAEDCSFCTTYPYAARPDRRAVAAKPPPFATTHTVVVFPEARYG